MTGHTFPKENCPACRENAQHCGAIAKLRYDSVHVDPRELAEDAPLARLSQRRLDDDRITTLIEGLKAAESSASSPSSKHSFRDAWQSLEEARECIANLVKETGEAERNHPTVEIGGVTVAAPGLPA